jgi:hypothetical protein
MRKTVETEPVTPVLQPPLTISAAQVCFVIAKVREFDTKDSFLESDMESSPSADSEIDALEDGDDSAVDDPAIQELTSFIDELSEDEQVDLVAVAWLGRDGGDVDDWSATHEEALRAHNESTAAYLLRILLRMPQVGDFLEAGFSTLGFSCEDFEVDRL